MGITYQDLLALYSPLQTKYNADALSRFNGYSAFGGELDPSIKRPIREDSIDDWKHSDPNLKKFDSDGKTYDVVYSGGKPVAITNRVGDDYTMVYDAANPEGRKFERQSDFNFYRDALENFAVQAGNVYLPGSGVITGKLASNGAQEMLNSPTGQFGLLVGGLTGAATGNLSNYQLGNSEGGLLGNDTAALNSNQVGALSGGAEGSTFSQIPGSSVAEAFGAPSLELGSGLAGQGSAIASGAAGGAYVSPFASGALTQAGSAGGMSALSPAALAEIAATTGMSAAGLAAAAGGAALQAPVADGFRTGINSFDDALQADAFAASKYEPSILDKILDKAQKNPYQAAKAVQGLLSVADAVAGNDDEDDKPYQSGPIDQSIVNKYKNIPSLAPIRYQQGYNLALPTGLLNNKPSSLLGG